MKRLLLVTGRPGIGKTTVLFKAAGSLTNMRYKVGGMITREVLHEGTRVGFEIMDLETGRKGWLAHVDQQVGPKVSRYRVNLADLEDIGVKAIKNAVSKAHIVIVDEIGPMELFSSAFEEAIVEAVESSIPLLVTIHHRSQAPLINFVKNRTDAETVEVTVENRAKLHEALVEKVVRCMRERNMETMDTQV